MITVADMDMEKFACLFEALVAPHDTQWWKPRLFKSYRGIPLISACVKTHREAMDGGDWDALGTAPPDDIAMQAAEKLASDLGLKVEWEPIEKGIGGFYFEDRKD